MTRYKLAFLALALFLISDMVFAQSGDTPTPSTNSPYTRYGYGQLADQSFGTGKAMGGIGFGLRSKNQINVLNPASYTTIDSLTFLFEGGFSLQNTNFKEGNIKKNAKNSSFDYIAMQFRISRRLAVSLGFLPFSSVGYSFSNSSKVRDENGIETNVTAYDTFEGNGDLNQVYAGAGFKIMNNLSVGANISYLYGTITRSSIASFSDANINRSLYMNRIKINNYKLDLGIQYSYDFNKKHKATLGAVYSLGHNLKADASEISQVQYYNSGSWYAQTSDTTDIGKDGFQLPHMFGIGATYIYDNKLTVGVDYTLQKWGESKFLGGKSQLVDRSKIAVGAEYIPNFMSRNYLNRVRYRIGGYYSDPYIKIKGENGAREYGVSAGFGLPVSRSLINISGQYVRVKPRVSDMIEENYLRINIGITFNERWFQKWKVQ